MQEPDTLVKMKQANNLMKKAQLLRRAANDLLIT
jgi:hypothetical protein